jgi:hypothetical protein
MQNRARELEADGDRIRERAELNRENARRAVENLMRFRTE